jgi:hypothetical protein
MESASDLKRIFRTTAVTCGAVTAGLFVYVLVVEFIKSRFGPFGGFLSGFPLQSLRYVLYGAAVGSVIIVRFASKALTRILPGEGVLRSGQRLSRASVITAMLAEVPAVLGFVLFFLSGFTRDFYVLLFASLFLEFMYFPRFNVWQDLIKADISKEGI